VPRVRTQPRGASAFVSANGLQLHYLEYGSGDDVVIVPGITSPAITWEFVSEQLAQDFHVVTMDVRGRGHSDRGETGRYLLPDYAADVAGLIEALHLVRPAVLGHSMGARIAAALGALHPASHGPLVLADPPLCGPGRDPYPFPLEPYVDSLRQAQRGATADDMRRYFPTWTDEQLQIRADWLATCDETAVVETYRNFHTEDFFEHWQLVRPPVLFVYGLESPVVPADVLDEIRAANPAAEIVGVAGAGHMIPWDNLDDFLAGVRQFLKATVG
jgi:N-formylmaleamate deformylase